MRDLLVAVRDKIKTSAEQDLRDLYEDLFRSAGGDVDLMCPDAKWLKEGILNYESLQKPGD